MREAGQRSRLALKALAQVGSFGQMSGQDLDGDRAIEAGVFGFVNLSHPSYAKYRKNLIVAENVPDQRRRALGSHRLSNYLEDRRIQEVLCPSV